MKRWLFLTAGWVILVISCLVLLYQLVYILTGPPMFEATATMGFTGSGAIQITARILIYKHPDLLLSTNVLYPVSSALGLAAKLSKKLGYPLTEEEVYDRLRGQISVICPRSENEPVQINVFSEYADEATEIANAVAASLKMQFGHFNNTTDSYQDVWIHDAADARRASLWLVVLSLGVTFFIEFLFLLGGFILIWIGRSMPPPPSVPPKSDRQIVSKY